MKNSKKNLCLGFIALTCGLTTMTAQVTIGSERDPASGALLELKQRTALLNNSTSDKGLLYPRVALTNIHELYPMFSSATTPAVKKEHVGLTVYNVTNNTIFTPGIYVWDGENWIRPVTKLPEIITTQINAVDLRSEVTTPIGEAAGEPFNNTNGELIFTNRNGATDIIIPEDGSYAFNFNLYGAMSAITDPLKTGIYYLSLWKNSVTDVDNLKDIAEIDILVAKTTTSQGVVNVYTYSITMAAFFNKGDKVKFKLTMYSNNQIPWKLYAKPYNSRDGIKANRTSMVWWQL